MNYAPTTIDLTRLQVPDVLETLSAENLIADGKDRIIEFWELARATNPDLPAYDTINTEWDPAVIILQAYAATRLNDRQRVNDGIKALLAVLAKGSNLDNVVASRNIQRLTIVEATDTTPAVMESDANLLRRYLLSYDLPAAGSAGRYLYDAWTAWPQSEDGTGMLDARVNGYAVHGRRGDTDVIVIGAGGALPSDDNLAAVRAAVTHVNRAPEGFLITVKSAVRSEYSVDLTIEVPGIGPAPDIVKAEAEARVTAAANARMLIGGEIPAGLLAGAAYNENVIKVTDNAPVVIMPDAYTVPVMTDLNIDVVVRA